MARQSEQLEREAAIARGRLADALEEFRARMTPGGLLDALVDFARGGDAAAYVGKLGREVRDNPLPTALVAAGIAWLIATPWLRRPNPAAPEAESPTAGGPAESNEAAPGFAPGRGVLAFSREEPLLVAGLGLLAGAVLGAAFSLPGSKDRTPRKPGNGPSKEPAAGFPGASPPEPKRAERARPEKQPAFQE